MTQTPASTALQSRVGSVVKFAAHPYHYGTCRIDAIEPVPADHPWAGQYIVDVTTVEATVTSRLLGHSRRDPFNGRNLRLYYYREADIVAACESGATLNYAYPV